MSNFSQSAPQEEAGTVVEGWHPSQQEAPKPAAKKDSGPVINLACILKYPYLTRGTKLNPNKYSVDLAQLSQGAVDKLTEIGLGHMIKNKGDDRGTYLTVSRPVREDFENKNVMTAKLEDGTDVTAKVGSGSGAIAAVSTYVNAYGTFSRLVALTITDLVEWESNREPMEVF